MDRILSYTDALREATEQEMERDPAVFLMGLGVDDIRGLSGTTRGLQERFGGDRVFDTPLSEDAMTGIAIGAALAGLRPIHTHVRMDFLMLAMNQLVNIAAKARYMYGGRVSVPLVVRALIGDGWGAQHSQGLHSFFAHIPGLKVVLPSSPYDAKGCLIESIRDDNPVIFVEHFRLYSEKGEVPQEAYTVPFGQAKVLRRGTDVTIVGISYVVPDCVRAATRLAETGVDAEVIDPVSLAPLDLDTITDSVRRTKRVLVVDTAWTAFGAAAEIVAAVTERMNGERIHVARLGFAPVPAPTTQPLADLFYPNWGRIAANAYELVRGESAEWLASEGERAPSAGHLTI